MEPYMLEMCDTGETVAIEQEIWLSIWDILRYCATMHFDTVRVLFLGRREARDRRTYASTDGKGDKSLGLLS